jgi:hypothetical protein
VLEKKDIQTSAGKRTPVTQTVSGNFIDRAISDLIIRQLSQRYSGLEGIVVKSVQVGSHLEEMRSK